nr:hypothetical protein [Aeromicrobium sp.]
MSEQPLPGVIPYVEFHQGPRRLLTVNLTSGNQVVVSKHRPIVSIDGRQYLVIWGGVMFEIPADRNVHVSVHVEADYVTQVASILLPPGDQPKVFRYETHYGSGVGSLTEQA